MNNNNNATHFPRARLIKNEISSWCHDRTLMNAKITNGRIVIVQSHRLHYRRVSTEKRMFFETENDRRIPADSFSGGVVNP